MRGWQISCLFYFAGLMFIVILTGFIVLYCLTLFCIVPISFVTHDRRRTPPAAGTVGGTPQGTAGRVVRKGMPGGPWSTVFDHEKFRDPRGEGGTCSREEAVGLIAV